MADNRPPAWKAILKNLVVLSQNNEYHLRMVHQWVTFVVFLQDIQFFLSALQSGRWGKFRLCHDRKDSSQDMRTKFPYLP